MEECPADTSNLMIFGVSTKTKFFTRFDLSGYSNKYAKGLGIYYLSRWENGPFFTLLGCVVDGVLKGDTSFPVGIDLISYKIPESFRLHQNYPNPFNPVTKIKFDIPAFAPLPSGPQDLVEKGQGVRLDIYNSLGQLGETLVNESLSPGTYEVEFDGSNYPSGVYFYQLTAGDASAPLSTSYSETRKMVLIK